MLMYVVCKLVNEGEDIGGQNFQNSINVVYERPIMVNMYPVVTMEIIMEYTSSHK